MPPLTDAVISDVEQLGPFDFRWPDANEHFESGWVYRLNVADESHAVRLGVGGREVYGRERCTRLPGSMGESKWKASKRTTIHRRVRW